MAAPCTLGLGVLGASLVSIVPLDYAIVSHSEWREGQVGDIIRLAYWPCGRIGAFVRLAPVSFTTSICGLSKDD
jgi:hypothetical protein